MIIEDKDGTKYSISGGELREFAAAIGDYYLVLSTIPKTRGNADGGLYFGDGLLKKTFEKKRWPVSIKKCTIGCRTFSPETFAKILKAAGVRKTYKKAARKKGKKK